MRFLRMICPVASLRRRLPAGAMTMAACLVLLASFPTEAHAYVDPGGGLLLWQLIASFVIGLAFYFRRVIAFLKALFGRKHDDQ